MEKPSRLIGSKFLKFLSKVAQPPVTFHSPPPSPRKASGPMIRIIPAEARRRSRNGVSFSSKPEPSSPKVSCMGQVKGKKKKKKSKNKSMTNQSACRPSQESTTCNNLISCVPYEVKRNPSKILVKVPKVTATEASDKNIHDGFVDNSFRAPKERVPSLGQMKNFASSRGALADFDLMREVLDYQLDDLKSGVCKETDEDHEKVKVNVPTSANKVGIKEVDLRKRRTIPPLVPLQL